jgi:hypothetical protein
MFEHIDLAGEGALPYMGPPGPSHTLGRAYTGHDILFSPYTAFFRLTKQYGMLCYILKGR